MACSLMLLSLSTLTTAYTTFETNCTHPTTRVNYVSSVNARGTMDILWSSLFTILACTWTVLHLNVPMQREGRDKGLLGDVKWMFKRGLSSFIWMLVVILAPEILIAKYWGDLVSARDVPVEIREFAVKDEVPWTTSHAFFANMGGFALRWYAPKRVGKLHHSMTQTELDMPHQITAGDLNNASVISLTAEQPVTPPALRHLNIKQIIALREAGLLPRLPYITLEELQDRNKSDSLIRVIAIVQIVWSVVQIIVRAARRLAISQLEVAVVAFAACAIAMYGLNWYKPKGVQVPITILQYPRNAPLSVRDIVSHRYSGYTEDGLILRWIRALTDRTFGQRDESGAVHNLAVGETGSAEVWPLSLGCVVFGGIHLAAWNFDFPTRVEQILWWIASLWCTFSVFGLLMLYFFLVFLQDHWNSWDQWGGTEAVGLGLLRFMPAAYLLARLYLLVEIFRTLCFLPESAYIATWATNVPHVA
ncbi:uncharacterized protein PAC_17315 [Phialocephala subalpina]|uniref:Uncharacterized protein n=1 Tax=Phialocephala subalpina TaxID=576137 RepID=A0A1L7XQT3_9HELO|nr:uncharacterized protein PAC_17315 [Phialocephala subalpina]